MDQYIIDENLGLDTLAERMIVRKKDAKKKQMLSKMELMDMATSAVAYQEYLPLLKLSYKNVASYIDIFTSFEHEISATFISLVSEHFPMGNLEQYLQKLRDEQTSLNNQLLDIWFAQILDGLMYLWSQNLLHRNFKPDSIYLRGENNEQNCSLIISDITPPSVAYDLRMRTRLPRRMYCYPHPDSLSILRALSYTAPEIFESGQYTVQSDVFSFGCVLLDMITCDMLTDEETLQLRICARYDAQTLSEILQNLQQTHESIPRLIGQMMLPDPQKRLTLADIQRDGYIIDSMHDIDSSQMKYPSERDTKWARDGLEKNGKIEYYIDYLKQHRNAESRIEHALQLCQQSKGIDLIKLAMSFEKDISPIVEHFLSNSIIVENTLQLLAKVLSNDMVITPSVGAFVTKMIPIFENDEHLIGRIVDVLITFAGRNAKLLINARLTSNLVQIMTKHTNHAEISSKCCTLLWLIAKDSITGDLRSNQVAILRILLNILEKHSDNGDLFTKACFAFLPFIFEKSTIDYLAQFNLVRAFTIGLEKFSDNRNAVKAALAVLSELFKLDERCVMRYLCSRSNDGRLIDSMEVLSKIYDQFKNSSDIARGIMTLLKSMSVYDDAVDEMISTKIDQNLLYDIKRFHSDNDDIARMCESLSKLIGQQNS